MKRTIVAFLGFVLATAYACTSNQKQQSASQNAAEQATTAGGKIGGAVTVLGLWGGQELETFNKLVKPFQEKTGITVEYEGTRDLDAVLTTRVAAGNPPDLAVLPNPGKMAEFAKQQKLVDLTGVLDMADMKQAYAQSWIDLGSVDGKLVGIFTKVAVKGLVWYNTKAFKEAKLEIPDSFEKLMATSQALAQKGINPWAIGVESGAASGWVGTDWLENIFLKTYGPEKYADWYQGKLSWTAPEMKGVWETWGKIVADKKMIYGGVPYVLSTNFGQAFAPLFQTPPKAYFHFQAAFIVGFIQKQFPNLKAVEDFDFFALPPVNAQYAKSLEIAGDLFGMFKKTPQSVELIKYMASPEAQAEWAKAGVGISPNRRVQLSDYSEPLMRNAAQLLTSAESAVFDASDMMPGPMNQAFWSGILKYISTPGRLRAVLDDLEKVRTTAYATK
jgi:alpha-glucoside transport system substrate-binding protein